MSGTARNDITLPCRAGKVGGVTTASIRTECLDENAALALVDGALASPARTQVERHLESCDACRELVAELARGFEPFRDSAPPSPDTERLPYAAVAAVLHGGRYRVEAEIGSGSAGTVYRARDEHTREIVALKIVTEPSLAHRFAREATALARLDHPAIVRYIAHGETEGGMYLAMEWLEGEELEQRLRRGALGWQTARVLALRLSEALAHAHALGLVHRDLSPRNVFLPAGRPDAAKLLDFGLVRLPDAHVLERTASQAILGTPYYMSPEQVRDPKRVDARSDLFGLGVLLYEMTCGRRPFEGADLFTLWVNIVDAAPPDLGALAPGTPPAFLAIVDALLAKDPAARPASAGFVHRALSTMEVSFAPTAPMQRPIVVPFPRLPAPLAATMPPRSAQPSAPPWSPPQAITAPPPAAPARSPSAGIFMAAGAGIMSLVAAVVFITYALTHRPSTRPENAPPTKPATTAPSARLGADDEEKGTSAETPPPPAPKPVPSSSIAPHVVFCGGDAKQTERSGTYSPQMAPQQWAVTTGGDCQLVLEDCTVTGENSVTVGYRSTVTLRRCHVSGAVLVLGPQATLVLEGTTIAGQLRNVGGHVIVK